MTSPVPPAAPVAPVAWLLICRDGVTPGIAYISRESAEEHIGPGERIVPLYDADVPALLARANTAKVLLKEASARLRERRESDGVLANRIDAALGEE